MNDDPSDESSRLDDLEMRIAHQDKTIAEMNEVITSQWRAIDALQRHVAQLREEFRNIAPRAQPQSRPTTLLKRGSRPHTDPVPPEPEVSATGHSIRLIMAKKDRSFN